MDEFKDSEFQGKVAAVTGAGGGIGRCHAIEFAKRGAKVLVNDLGGSVDGTGAGDAADAVVAEIKAFGGNAVANKASVADRDGAKSIVDDAIANYGRIDILVNNAGILRDRTFKNMTLDEFDLVMQVHLTGTAYVTHAAWPHMYEQELRAHRLHQFRFGHLRQLRPVELRRREDGHAGARQRAGARGREPQRPRQLSRARRRDPDDQYRAGPRRESRRAGSQSPPGTGQSGGALHVQRGRPPTVP